MRDRAVVTLAVLILGSAAVPAFADSHRLAVGNFSSSDPQEQLPSGWEPLLFEGMAKGTDYRLQVVDGRSVIEARSNSGSSGLISKRKIDPASYPFVSWSWKVANVLARGDVNSREGDDYPARLYITFAYDPDQVGFWESLKYAALKFFYGEYPPIGAINYIWANRAEKGSIVPNPYTDRVRMIVLQSGSEKVGQWIDERRNIVEDYRQAFGGAAPLISGVAIMTDTDNTGESALAWYGDIVFSED